jgi:hypothetical protein
MADDEKFFDSVYDVVSAYDDGFVGAYSDPEAAEALRDDIKAKGGIPDGAEACTQFGLAETGKNKVSLPFLEVISLYEDCLPGGAQGRGDCVSWSARNAALGTMCCEITSGSPDPVTGKLEGAPEVSDTARLNGVLSTEAIYNWRRHSGDGWSCAAADRVLLNDSGLWVRKEYPEINVDFTRYSSRNAGIYGSRTPPDSWREIGRLHLVQTITEINDYEDLRDLLANGYCVSSCGGESFSDSRDENGVSKRTARGWAHAMAYLGVDDREEIIKLYGSPLILVQNSWGAWNGGPRRVYKTNFNIPVGSFWARWTDLKNRYATAVSGVNGWPPKKLKSMGALGKI